MFGIQQKSTPAHCIAAWFVHRTISCTKPRALLCIVHWYSRADSPTGREQLPPLARESRSNSPLSFLSFSNHQTDRYLSLLSSGRVETSFENIQPCFACFDWQWHCLVACVAAENWIIARRWKEDTGVTLTLAGWSIWLEIHYMPI